MLDNKASTDLYIKPTDRHQYLHYSSLHLDHTKKSIVYGQTLRLSRICSVEADFVRRKKEMKSWFLKRGYPANIINREKLVFSRRGGVTKWVPLVTTHHPLLKSVDTILYKHFYLLHMDKEVKKIFPVAIIVSFKSARKLSSYLVRAKLYLLQRTVGSFKCNKSRSQVCMNVIETEAFTSTATGESFKVNHKFNCDDKCYISTYPRKKKLRFL